MNQYRAAYSDGRTATRHDVEVVFESEGLRIQDASGQFVAHWAYQGLRALEETYEDDPLRLASAAEPQSRLIFPDNSLMADLRARAPHLKGRARSWGERLFRWFAELILVSNSR